MTGELGRRAQTFLDADQLVVLGQAVGAGQRAGLDLAGVEFDRAEPPGLVSRALALCLMVVRLCRFSYFYALTILHIYLRS